VRQGRRHRALATGTVLVAWAAVCAGAARGAEPAVPATTVNAWATGGVSGTAAGAMQALPYWQAPALPQAVIQGGAIPPGWSPQAVPYRGTGPDGKPITAYYAPTYVFTYPVGPPMLAAATMPAASQVNRRQAMPAAYQPAAAQGWNYQTQSAPPPAYTLPPATVARYQPTPYQYPPGSKQLAGTPVVPPSGPPVTAFTAAPPTYQPVAPPPAAPPPPPTQWAASQQPPPAGLMPQAAAPVPPPPSIGQEVAAAAPPMVAGAAGAVAAASQPQAPPPSAFAAPPPAPFTAPATTAAIPAQPVSTSLAPQPQSAAPAGRSANTHLWRVVGVHDGDTITCLDESNQQQKVRLAEIDAPEIGQEYGRASREALAEMVFGKPVEVVEEGKDRYGRWVGHVSAGGIDVNRQMVTTGNAWQYVDYSRDPTLAAAQAQAQAQRLGLWAQPNPTPPWDFRNNGQK
jgi:endonuclease YncB( thermonuclease family)